MADPSRASVVIRRVVIATTCVLGLIIGDLQPWDVPLRKESV